MRYIHFYGDAGTCGTDYHILDSFPDDTTDAFLEGVSSDLAYDCAQSFSYCYTGWGEDFEDEEDEAQYYDDAMSHCGWEELSEAKWKELKEEYE